MPEEMFEMKTIDPNVLDNLTFEEIKPILKMMLQNLTVLNYVIAEVAKETGVADRLLGMEEEDNSPSTDHTGMYL